MSHIIVVVSFHVNINLNKKNPVSQFCCRLSILLNNELSMSNYADGRRHGAGGEAAGHPPVSDISIGASIVLETNVSSLVLLPLGVGIVEAPVAGGQDLRPARHSGAGGLPTGGRVRRAWSLSCAVCLACVRTRGGRRRGKNEPGDHSYAVPYCGLNGP